MPDSGSNYTQAMRQAAVEVLDDASPWEQVLQPFLTRSDESPTKVARTKSSWSLEMVRPVA